MIGLPLKRSRLPHRFQRAILFAIIASMPLVAAGARPATAIQQRQPSDGPLDESFGFGGGFVTTSIGVGRDEARAVAVQPDGKIVVAGSASTAAGRDMALVRYNPNGTLDTSFGNGGRVVTPVGGYGEATALVLQPDGKIVTAGYAFTASGGVFVVARFAANGPLDPSFGAAGLAVTPIGTDAFASGVALQSGGRIVAIGSSLSSLATSPQDYDFTLVRYTANGLLDSSFGNGGIATARTGSGRHEAYAGAVLSDGRIVAAGYSSTLGDQKFQVTRYSVDGSLDTTFGTGGSVTTDIGTALATALSLAVQTDGKLIVGGAAGKTSAIVRYHADGSLDASFGVDGKVISPTSANVTSTQDVTLQPDGKIVADGFATTGLTEALVVTRYLADGALDPTFGVDGKATPPIGDSGATAVAVQPDGKLVVAGITSSDHFVHSLLVVARFDVAYSGLVTGAPTRVLDTRPGPRPAAGSITRVTTGAPAGTSAVLVNLTVTGATEAGYLTANKCSKLLPGRQNNSNVNYQPGADVANSAVVNIDPDGSFCLYTDHAAHLIVDLQGRYAARGLGLVTAKPTRVLDTRTGARPAVGSITRVTTGAPAGTSAVLVNLTVTGATEAGYLTANKCSTLLPGLQNNSNVNYQAGSDVANSAVVNIDPDGSFCLYTDHAAHLIVDLQGTYQTPQGRDLTTSGPTRVLDTRSGPRAQAGSITRVTTGAPAGTSAVLVNLTVTGATEAGYLTANKCSTLLPGLQNNSNVNYQAGSDVANSAVVNIDPDGSFCLYTDHAAHLIVDLQGAYP